ncbi:MAG: FliH/SctL family protein [Stellaceae bacterium]
MTGPTSATAPPLLRWQIPELETSAEPALSLEHGESDSIAADGEDGDARDEEAALAEIIREEIAKGYAEGWQRGLAEGREEGYAQGFDEGTRAAREAAAAQARRFAGIIDRLSAPLPALDGQVEEAVAALALEVARCVIGSETSRSRGYLVRLIREAVARVPIEMGALKVVLNPADLELVRALAPDLEGGSALLISDDAVEAGDCLVVADGQGAPIKDMRWRPRTGEGMSQVDLSLATRWRAVMLALFEGEEK